MHTWERWVTYGVRLWLNGWAWLLAGLLWLGPFALAGIGFAWWVLTQPLPVWSGGAQIAAPQPLPPRAHKRRRERVADEEPTRFEVR